MRYLILTDIHGNNDALDAVLAESEREVNAVLVLGDLVGYGAGPNEVVERIRGLEKPTMIIRGNHDKVCAGLEPEEQFNTIAREAAEWTRGVLTDENLAYLRRLPPGPVEIASKMFICHGSPRNEDEYLLTLEVAAEIFSRHPGRVIFFGHTHLPTLFSTDATGVKLALLEGDGRSIRLDPKQRYLLNPGAVGQPRDRDPRAAYFVYDAEAHELRWYRTPYSIELAQNRIIDAGLPPILAHRLAAGL